MDFDAILKSSLAVVNDGYQEGLADLNEVAAEVSAAIKRNAGEQFALVVGEISSDLKGATFRVYFDTNVKNSRAKVIDVLYIRIPSTGYPLAHGLYDKGSKSFYPEAEIENKENLAKIFAKLIQDPESSLIQAIGFALRTRDDEDIPF